MIIANKKVALRLLVLLILFLTIRGTGYAGVNLHMKPAGSSGPWHASGFWGCSSSGTDFQAARHVPGYLSGYCRFDWTLYKDGQQVSFDRQIYDFRNNGWLPFQNYTFQNTFFNITTGPGKYSATLEVRQRNGPFWNYNFNTQLIYDGSIEVILYSAIATQPIKIKDINGAFVSPPSDGSPIQVSLSGGIIMDASAGTCEPGYAVIVQESNLWWDRTFLHEWFRWFSGQAPANIDLQQLTTSHSQSDGTGYFSLNGGPFTSGIFAAQQRFYRVGLQSAGAPWAPKMALIQVNW
ncbi:MAG: hypothetical protein ACLGJB_12220 [Blastocatellia bacterium]